MQKTVLISLVAAATACHGMVTSADAASRPRNDPDAPQVIQGIGPDEAALLEQQPGPDMTRQPRQTVPVRAMFQTLPVQSQHYYPVAALPGQPNPPIVPEPRQRQVRVAAAQPGAYGGGFIEMLVTGGSGASQPASAAPRYAPAGPAGQVGYARPGQQLAYAPARESVKRGVDPKYLRQEVDYAGGHKAGTIVIDTPNKFLYLVEGNGRALRYGIGVGRPGFEWSGVKTISRKAEWPAWTPPPEMLLRRPDLPHHMEGGPENPLGARAMYLGSSLYRIHGTNEPDTIGTNVSSGCIRLTNDDVTDLYGRVRMGAKVVVM